MRCSPRRRRATGSCSPARPDSAYRNGEVVRDASRRTLLDQLDPSLRDLGTDHLDLWQIHRWDENTPLEESLAALEHAVATGRTRYVGISNFYGWQMSMAHTWLAGRPDGVPLVSNQVEYSLLRRDAEDEVIPAAEYHRHGRPRLVTARPRRAHRQVPRRHPRRLPGRRPRAGSSSSRPTSTPDRAGIVEAVARAADGLDVTMSHVALAWLLGRPCVAAALIGARTIGTAQREPRRRGRRAARRDRPGPRRRVVAARMGGHDRWSSTSSGTWPSTATESRHAVCRLLTDAAEYHGWELDRLRKDPDGKRTVRLRRKIIRMRSTL